MKASVIGQNQTSTGVSNSLYSDPETWPELCKDRYGCKMWVEQRYYLTASVLPDTKYEQGIGQWSWGSIFESS